MTRVWFGKGSDSKKSKSALSALMVEMASSTENE